MKTKIFIALALLVFFIFGNVKAQISIPNSVPVVENFDAMGSTLTLPSNWKASATGINADWTTATNLTTVSQQACGGVPTAGGRYNWGISATCTDRAIGFMTSGSYASPNSILSFYQNTSGTIISDLSISFDVERYRINTASFSLAFFTSLDGVTWTPQASGDIALGVFATATSSYTFNAPQTVSKTVTLTGINLANNASFYLKWVFTNTGSSSAQGIGIDNVSLTATLNSCTIPSEPTISSSSIVFSNITQTSMQLDWTRGNGTNCIVVAKALSAVTNSPTDGNNYTANSFFGAGSTTGTNQYVIYNGTGSSVIVSGLLTNTNYYFSIYEYTINVSCTNYLTSTFISSNTTTLVGTSLNLYRGTLHSHSVYSDGDNDNRCPTIGSAATCCYNIANAALNMDFMGISDHNHNEGGLLMTIPKFQSGISEAANYNTANVGNFVALYGLEWGTISNGGHVVTYGVDSLIGWNAGIFQIFNAKTDYNGLFSIIASHTNAFANLAHPDLTDYNNIFTSPYNATNDMAITGLSLVNGPSTSTDSTYTNPPLSAPDEPRFKDLLKIGYHIGPVIDLDNHNSSTMGKTNQGRTVILASSLSKASIVDAIRQMHFFASEDYNAAVDYKINSTIEMGSIVSDDLNPTITITASDADVAETVSKIEIFYGIPGSGIDAVLLSSVNNSSTLNYTHSIANLSTYYYYAKITQTDGHRIWTSPIWYTKDVALPIESNCFELQQIEHKIKISWASNFKSKTKKFVLEKSYDGINFEIFSIIDQTESKETNDNYFVYDSISETKNIYYKLKEIDCFGNILFNEIRVIHFIYSDKETINIFPNPTNSTFYVTCSLSDFNELKVVVRSIANGIIMQQYFLEKKNYYAIDLTNQKSGIYIIEILVNDTKFIEKIIKE